MRSLRAPRFSLYSVFTILSIVLCGYFLFLFVFMIQRHSLPASKIMVTSLIPKQSGTNEKDNQHSRSGPTALRRVESITAKPQIPTKIAETQLSSTVSRPISSLPVRTAPITPIQPSLKLNKQVSTKKFPDPVMFTSSSNESPPPAVLVVGGTDGSGTRRVVQVLTELGVKMVSEDPETYDIHADLISGWPPVVKEILSHTHSLNYDPAQLDEKVRTRVNKDLRRLLEQVRRDSFKGVSRRLAVGGVLPRPAHLTAKHVLYGFKAPVAMTLLPYWSYLESSLRFVHCVRDGRDIAFSANQGPVDKFYGDMYHRRLDLLRLSKPLKGVKLWSDWNSQAFTWARQAAQQLADNNKDNKFFGYLLLHSEDLVSSDRQRRFAAMLRLSRFVGSTISDEELCCLAMADDRFMGSHDRSTGETAAQLRSRYGKWKQQTEHDPQLRKDLLRYGQEGLSLLGYSEKDGNSDGDNNGDSLGSGSDGFTCSSHEDCGPRLGSSATAATHDQRDSFISAPDYAVAGQCEASFGFDYTAGDLSSVVIASHVKSDCCRACLSNPQCRVFTFDPSTGVCYLKAQDLGKKVKKHLISGRVIAAAAVSSSHSIASGNGNSLILGMS